MLFIALNSGENSRADAGQAGLGHMTFSEGMATGKDNGELLLARLGSCRHLGDKEGYGISPSHP